MQGAVANAALKRAKNAGDELQELRRKTKHQEIALKTLTQVQRLARVVISCPASKSRY